MNNVFCTFVSCGLHCLSTSVTFQFIVSDIRVKADPIALTMSTISEPQTSDLNSTFVCEPVNPMLPTGVIKESKLLSFIVFTL